jgi:hypothetical protein
MSTRFHLCGVSSILISHVSNIFEHLEFSNLNCLIGNQERGGHALSLFPRNFHALSLFLESQISISSISNLNCPVWKRLAVHRPDFSILESQISDLETRISNIRSGNEPRSDLPHFRAGRSPRRTAPGALKVVIYQRRTRKAEVRSQKLGSQVPEKGPPDDTASQIGNHQS